MKIIMERQDIDLFCDITLSLDLDYEYNRIAFVFAQKDGDKMKVIKCGCFKVYEELREGR